MRMKKAAKSGAALLLSVLMLAGVACGDKNPEENGGPVGAEVKVARSSDKILQSYAADTTAMAEMREKFMGSLMDEFHLTAAQNEYESKQIIITPDKDVAAYDVTVGDFKKGDQTLAAENFDVRHEYYHLVETIYDTLSEMQPGMYPDALLPIATAKEYGLNTIKAGENQGVYITVKVPKGQEPGVYEGEISVSLDGAVSKIKASVTVLAYELPDTVSLPSCVPLQVRYLMQGELSDTQEMYDMYSDALNEYRLAVQYLDSYYIGSAQDTQAIELYTGIAVEKAVEAAQDVTVPSYAIKCYELADAKYNYVLNQELFLNSLQRYIDKSVETGVNLFEKAYCYLGNIIDEPDLGGSFTQERANYVCAQYDDVLKQAAQYARNRGASQEVIDGVSNLPHVVTGAYSDKLPGVQTYCPTADTLSSSAVVEDYRELREVGKDYWWYTCTVPKIPYPSYHIDDNGVSSRVMFWMMKEYDIAGYLTWEAAYYIDANKTAPDNVVYGRDNYDNIHRWGDAYGDGWFFYPGAPFGIEGPVPALRLFTMRDGLEDYEIIHDVENTYAELGERHGATLSFDGIMTELYAMMYNDNRVYCESTDVDRARDLLSSLAVLAEKGVAISDYAVGEDGKVSAKIYAPVDTDIKINGESAQGTITNGGKVYEIEMSAAEFSVEADGETFSVSSAALSVSAPSAARVSVYDAQQNYDETAVVTEVGEEGAKDVRIELKPENTRFDYRLDENNITKDTHSVIVFIRNEGTEKVKLNISLYGRALRSLDSVYVHEGMNAVRFDRIGDLDWLALRTANALVFTRDGGSAATLEICGVLTLN